MHVPIYIGILLCPFLLLEYWFSFLFIILFYIYRYSIII